MFKIKLDEKWIKKQFDELQKEMPDIIANRLEYTARGVIQDLISEILKIELAKPEYQERMKKLAREMILEEKSENLIKNFLHQNRRF